jgi:EKC/KEOPS complex subunit CGI121/TPRKB
VKLALRSNPTASDEEKTDWVVDEAITNESVSKHLGDVVEGTSVEISEGGAELGVGCDVERVKKMYKLGDMGGAGKNGKMNGDSGRDERKKIEAVVLGIMALKGS